MILLFELIYFVFDLNVPIKSRIRMLRIRDVQPDRTNNSALQIGYQLTA